MLLNRTVILAFIGCAGEIFCCSFCSVSEECFFALRVLEVGKGFSMLGLELEVLVLVSCWLVSFESEPLDSSHALSNDGFGGVTYLKMARIMT